MEGKFVIIHILSMSQELGGGVDILSELGRHETRHLQLIRTLVRDSIHFYFPILQFRISFTTPRSFADPGSGWRCITAETCIKHVSPNSRAKLSDYSENIR
jgi:hypothetical protein